MLIGALLPPVLHALPQTALLPSSDEAEATSVGVLLNATKGLLYSKFLCVARGEKRSSACLGGESTLDLSRLRLPPRVNLLIYGASYVRELAQLVLAAHEASGPLLFDGGERDPRLENVTCWCGFGLELCDTCVDAGSWILHGGSNLTMVTNVKRLQTQDGLTDLEELVEQRKFTHAWVGQTHGASYWDTEIPTTRLGMPSWQTSFFRKHFPSGLQFVEDLWDGDSGYPFNQNGKGCAAQETSIHDHAATWEKGVAEAGVNPRGHQCLFVCNTEAPGPSCRSGPLIPVVSDLIAGIHV